MDGNAERGAVPLAVQRDRTSLVLRSPSFHRKSSRQKAESLKFPTQVEIFESLEGEHKARHKKSRTEHAESESDNTLRVA